ncbi:hypothetical protein [Kribbella deserti]|uniref:Cation/H+ exchanger domain-containing protein n=1 Tax=Kribbella deserti TaxID=1926257 RepID=A0ABV6QI64_9ACTN
MRPATVAGLLVAALIAPHLTGPWIARLLAKRRDIRGLLTGVFIEYGVAVAIATVLLGRVPVSSRCWRPWWPVALVPSLVAD